MREFTQKAIEAIQEVHGDTSISPLETRRELEEILSVVESLLWSLPEEEVEE